jgi:urease accessory protein
MSAVLDGAAQVLAPTNLLALAALGLMAGQHARQLPRVTFALLAAGLLVGSTLIALAFREPPAAVGLLALAAIAGLIVAGARSFPPSLTHALAFLTGTALALNTPPQAIMTSIAVATQLGAAIAALAAFAVAAVVATKADQGWQRVALRIVGSWIAASAILVLALRLFR